ncbi:MAG: hypothetical protein CMP39_06915 [Rickettsiales bacterium]|nr:hypothetical protein [Rickettsiales bacterium]|tara:strand:- start:1678 stop:2580 length:903 start_codon:yes stop_codon:yes gene_type:complete
MTISSSSPSSPRSPHELHTTQEKVEQIPVRESFSPENSARKHYNETGTRNTLGEILEPIERSQVELTDKQHKVLNKVLKAIKKIENYNTLLVNSSIDIDQDGNMMADKNPGKAPLGTLESYFNALKQRGGPEETRISTQDIQDTFNIIKTTQKKINLYNENDSIKLSDVLDKNFLKENPNFRYALIKVAQSKKMTIDELIAKLTFTPGIKLDTDSFDIIDTDTIFGGNLGQAPQDTLEGLMKALSENISEKNYSNFMESFYKLKEAAEDKIKATNKEAINKEKNIEANAKATLNIEDAPL